MNLYSGLLWLVRPTAKREDELAAAVEYTQDKTGLPVRLIAFHPDESYPLAYAGIPVRPDKRIMANHIFLVTKTADGGEVDEL